MDKIKLTIETAQAILEKEIKICDNRVNIAEDKFKQSLTDAIYLGYHNELCIYTECSEIYKAALLNMKSVTFSFKYDLEGYFKYLYLFYFERIINDDLFQNSAKKLIVVTYVKIVMETFMHLAGERNKMSLLF